MTDPTPIADILNTIQARPGIVPAADGWEPPPVEDLAVVDRRRATRVGAWRRCLLDAHHDEYLDADLDDLDADQNPAALRRFAGVVADRAAPVRTLVLAGRVGAGKTRGAIAVGNAVTRHGLSARFVKHSAYLAWLRPDGCPPGVTQAQVRAQHRACDLLIVDDLGAELERDASDFVRGETNDLIGDRVSSGRATIVTTNLTSARITELLGERLMSRLGAHAFVATFTGSDRRRPVSW